MKGISLPVETVVLLILAAVVLAALLGFFMGFFTPAQTRAQIMQKQSALCQQIFAADQTCDISKGKIPSRVISELKSNVCGKPKDEPVCGSTTMDDQACIKACCSFLCPS